MPKMCASQATRSRAGSRRSSVSSSSISIASRASSRRCPRSSRRRAALPDIDDVMLGRLKQWQESRILARGQLDEAEWQSALLRFPFTRHLSIGEQARLRELVILFMHDKRFSAARGLKLTQAMCVHVAVQACTLILHLGLEYYRGWSEIILYPAEFVPRHEYMDESGVVHQGDESFAGEAWLHGPVILSWADIAGSEYPDGVNVVIHEFAHKLDMLNGDANGFPPLHRGMSREAWSQAFSAAYEDFCRRVDRDEDTV